MTTAAQRARAQPPHVPIEDHGIIGDLHTAALVSTDGDIDWLCLPRFDSPSVFAALLDQERGGRFTVRCTGATRTKQMYLPDSNILLTRFLGENCVGEVVDFMVPHEHGRDGRGAHQVVRLVRAVRGRVEVEVHCAPAFDYGRARTEVDIVEGAGAFFSSPVGQLVLRSTVPLVADGAAAVARPVLEEGRGARPGALPARVAQAAGPGRGRRPARGDPVLLAALDPPLPLPRPLPRDGRALGAHAEAPGPPAHRCPRRRAHHVAARGARRHPQLGLPLHLGPRRGLHRLRADAAGVHRRGGRVHDVAGGALHATPRPAAGCRSSTASTAVRCPRR